VVRISAFFFLLPFCSSSQTLRLSSASAVLGGRVFIEISLQSPKGIDVSALQWEITFPATQLSFLDKDTAAGAAASAAGKSVTCTQKPGAPPTGTPDDLTRFAKDGKVVAAGCMLYGGREPLPDGVAAKLGFQVAAGATPGSVPIGITRVLAVSKDLKTISLKDANTTVNLR